MTESQNKPSQMLFEIDCFRRIQLSSVLSNIQSFAELMDPEIHREASDTLHSLSSLLAEDDVDLETYVSDQQLASLTLIVDAAWTYTNRCPSPVSITGLNTITGLDDADFCDLSTWLVHSRQRVFFSAGETDAQDLSPTVVEIDEKRHKQLLDILTYVKEIHFHIDPDMYKIGPMHFDALKDVLRRSALRSEITISSDELFRVSTLIDAACTYSYRSKGNGLPRVKDQDFERLSTWIGNAHQAMLRSDGHL